MPDASREAVDGGRQPPGDDRYGPDSQRETAGSDFASVQREAEAWLAMGQQALGVGGKFSRLLQVELQLAAADGARLVLLGLLMVPLALLAWVGLSVLLAWLVYDATAHVALGLVGFLGLQLLAMLGLLLLARRYRESLRFPASRRQWRAMTGGGGDDESAPTDT